MHGARVINRLLGAAINANPDLTLSQIVSARQETPGVGDGNARQVGHRARQVCTIRAGLENESLKDAIVVEPVVRLGW